MSKLRRMSRELKALCIIIAGIIAVTVIGGVLRKNYLLSWQFPLYLDRKAIIKYVREAHPDSKIAEEHIKYKADGFYFFIFEIYPDCNITFEENGFQYLVDYYHKEKRVIDYYNREKLTNDVRVFINEEFFKPRGIENVDVYCNYGFKSPSELPTEWSEYDDSYTVYLDIHDQGSTPQEVGWMYDFYKFWNDNSVFPPEWYLSFTLWSAGKVDGNLYGSYKEPFDNEADMYKYFNEY